MKKLNRKVILTALAVVFTFSLIAPLGARAATAINLGTAANFAVLGGSAITNTGTSVINGDMGLSPGTAVTGFPPGTLNGASNVTNALAVQAKTDLVSAYDNAAGQTPVSTVPTELGGTIKTAGTYDSAAGTFGITGTLTLDAQGNPNAVFVFKTASTLITAGGSNVVLINGAQACNVFWQVGSSATLGTNSNFKGNILALTSVTLTTGANVEGRVLARNGAVTLDTNNITKVNCAAVVVPIPTPSPIPAPSSTPVTPVPVTPTSTPQQTPAPVVIPTPLPIPASTSTPVTPNFPNTGFAPQAGIVNTNTAVFSGILIIASAVLVAVLRKRKI
jgi:hypothetical protein